MGSCIACVLLDVGGTLWSNRWNAEAMEEARITQLRAALPELTLARTRELDHVLHACHAQYRRGLQQANLLTQDTNAVIRDVAQWFGLPTDDQTILAVRTALSVAPVAQVPLFEGVRGLLEQIKAWGLGCVAVSNATWRDSAAYRRTFVDLGIEQYFDAVVSSVEVGFYKPHRAMFDAAFAAGHCLPQHCVMIGDSEVKDVQPTLALGMRTIRVAIDEPKPAASAAHAVVDSLPAAAAVLQAWISPVVH